VAVLVVVLGFAGSAADAWKGLLLDKWLLPNAPDFVVAHRAVRQSVGFITEFAIIFSLHLVMLHVRDSAARAAELAAAREETARLALAAAAAESAATSAKLEALRYQLNPHFLFNTLNAISSSVLTGKPEAAEATLTRLCAFLRATLAASDSGMVAVEDELQTIADYLAIEKARLGDRLRLDFDCPPSLRDAAVPSFLLQPLVENAIKHGVGATSRAVTLRVDVSTPSEGELRITVSDDAPATRVAPIKGTGLGLANIRERLATVFGPGAFLEAAPTATGFRASVIMPLTRINDEPVYARAAG
jgi:LytS/YehU family sensor histidine kinase